MKDYIMEQEEVVRHWKITFSQLAALANEAIVNVPRMVYDADMMAQFCNPPEEIRIFINHCKWLVGEMKTLIACARD